MGEFAQDSILHCASWLSHRSKPPAKSASTAVSLAAVEAINEDKILATTYSELLDMRIGIHLCLCSDDLFSSLSTQRNFIDRSIRADVDCIRYQFQLANVNKVL